MRRPTRTPHRRVFWGTREAPGAKRRFAARALLASALASACARPPTEAPSIATVEPAEVSKEPEVAPPRLVVLVVIDQLPSWSFDPQTSLFEGGLRRLLDEGTYFPHAAFPYAVTMTAPGHAALGTGAAPAASGIMANRWYDADSGQRIGAVSDSEALVLRIDPPGHGPGGVSSRNLLVEGVADALRRATDGRGRSIAVGLKDRAAVLMLGKQPDLAIWYEPEQLAMTTSRAYTDTLPPWLGDLARQGHVTRQLDFVWEPLDPERLAEATGTDDLDWGGGDAFGLGNTFPYELSKTGDPGRALAATPLGNTLVVQTARAAIEAESLGADDVPDLLGLGFSAHDYAGHLWGQESWERLDMLLRLDRELGELFAFLDTRVGTGRWAAVLTSDHGATPLPERAASAKHEGEAGRRIHHFEIERAVETALVESLGVGPWVSAIEASTVYLNPRFRDASTPQRTAAMQAAIEAVRRVEGIAYAGSRSALVGDCGARLDLDALVCWSLRPDRSGDIYFAAAPGSYASHGDEAGTSHGSPSDHDRYVPIVVHARGWPAVRRDEVVSTLQVAPTLAHLLGVAAPEAATAPALRPTKPR